MKMEIKCNAVKVLTEKGHGNSFCEPVKGESLSTVSTNKIKIKLPTDKREG